MPTLELASLLYIAGFAFILIGIIILAMNMFFRKKGKHKGEVGGVILIGPFPIIFGTSSRMMKVMLIIAFAFVAIILFMTLLPYLTQAV